MVWGMAAGGFKQRSSDLTFEAVAILVACCAIVLAVIALMSGSRFVVWPLLIISVVAACWSGLCAWILISPITVVGLRCFQGMTVAAWLYLIGLLTLFFLPWMWGVVCYRLRERVTHVA